MNINTNTSTTNNDMANAAQAQISKLFEIGLSFADELNNFCSDNNEIPETQEQIERNEPMAAMNFLGMRNDFDFVIDWEKSITCEAPVPDQSVSKTPETTPLSFTITNEPAVVKQEEKVVPEVKSFVTQHEDAAPDLPIRPQEPQPQRPQAFQMLEEIVAAAVKEAPNQVQHDENAAPAQPTPEEFPQNAVVVPLSQNVILPTAPQNNIEEMIETFRPTIEQKHKPEPVEPVSLKLNDETAEAGVIPVPDIKIDSTSVREHHETVEFTDFKYGVSHKEILSSTIQDLTNTQEILTNTGVVQQQIVHETEVKVDYKTIKMSDDDAVFFAGLVQQSTNNTAVMPVTHTIASEIQQALNSDIEEVRQPAKISAALLNAIQDAAKNNQPIRIDFDKKVSVILKVNKDGSIMANFIPGDKAAEKYLRDNISFLRQRFDEQDIPYEDLSHSHAKDQNKNRRNKEDKKENSNE